MTTVLNFTAHLPRLLFLFDRSLVALPILVGFSVDELAQEPRMRRALHLGSPHAQVRFGAKPTQFLLIVAEEKVISTVWHEYLVTHVAGGQATGSGISRSRSTPRVKTLNERSLG